MSDFLSPREVAAELGLGISTVYRALEEGRLPGRKIGTRWVTLREQLVEFIRDDRVPGHRVDPMPKGADRFLADVTELQRRSAA